ncbi:hypothetical protein FQZ97_1147330 [compost metagenome]
MVDVLEGDLTGRVRYIDEVSGSKVISTGTGKVCSGGEPDKQPLHAGIAQRADIWKRE